MLCKKFRNLFFVFVHEIKNKLKWLKQLKDFILFNPFFYYEFGIILFGEILNYDSEIIKGIDISIRKIEKLLIVIILNLGHICTRDHLAEIFRKMFINNLFHLSSMIMNVSQISHKIENFIMSQSSKTFWQFQHWLVLKYIICIWQVKKNNSWRY